MGKKPKEKEIKESDSKLRLYLCVCDKVLCTHTDEGEEFEIIEQPDGSVKRIPLKKKEDEILGCNMWHEN